jgi:hypothetical protein
MKTLGLLDMSEPVNWGIDMMTLSRKQRLDRVGFYWGDNITPKNTTDEIIFSKPFQDRVWKKYKEDLVWNPWYNRLVQFHHKHGHTNVERAKEEPSNRDDGLEMWVVQQRMVREDMPDRRRMKLDAIGFDWTVSETTQLDPNTITTLREYRPTNVSWYQRIQQVKAYKDRNGDVNVPIDYDEIPGLGKWVHRQRRNKRLSLRNRLQLQDIGLFL